jgi:hypothetical protein
MEENRVDTKKKSMSFLIVCLVSVIIVMGGVILYLLLYGNTDTQEFNSNETKQTEELKEAYLTSEVAKKLLDYLPVSRPFTGYIIDDFNNAYSVYSNQKVEVSEMDANWMVYNAIRFSKRYSVECTDYGYEQGGANCEAYKIDEINTILDSYYGRNIVKLPERINGDFLFYCDKKNTEYVCHSGGGGYVAGPIDSYFGLPHDSAKSKLIVDYDRAEKENNHLYMYVKFARIDFKTPDNYGKIEDVTFQLYKYGSGNELILDTVFNGKDYYEENVSKQFDDKIIEQFKDKMTTYKITYRVGEMDSYTLLSVEPVE